MWVIIKNHYSKSSDRVYSRDFKKEYKSLSDAELETMLEGKFRVYGMNGALLFEGFYHDNPLDDMSTLDDFGELYSCCRIESKYGDSEYWHEELSADYIDWLQKLVAGDKVRLVKYKNGAFLSCFNGDVEVEYVDNTSIHMFGSIKIKNCYNGIFHSGRHERENGEYAYILPSLVLANDMNSRKTAIAEIKACCEKLESYSTNELREIAETMLNPFNKGY